MITAAADALQRQQYLRAVQQRDFFRAALGMRLALFADKPAAGWRFYTAERGVCAALAVHGGAAFACGGWDAGELDVFLRFLQVETLLAPPELRWPGSTAVPLYGFALPAGGQLPPRPFPAGVTVQAPDSLREAAQLLWGGTPAAQDGTADNFCAELCAARNHGMAELRLACCGAQPAATVSACAIFAGEAYLAAGETAPALRGQGIGSALIVSLANSLAARGLRVTLLCEAPLCAHYARLGFAPAATLLRQTRQNPPVSP